MKAPDSSNADAADTRNQSGMNFSFLEAASFWSNIAVITLGVLAAIAAAFALYFSSRLGAAKDAGLEKFQDESKVAISDAGARAAEANQRAAEANKLAESFRLDIAKANERAAAANETAEKERLARLQLEARLADRVITDAQRTRLTAAFAALKGQTVDVGMFGDNPDIASVSGAILGCLAAAGVRTQTFSALGLSGVRGVLIGVNPEASAAIKAAAQAAMIILRETLADGVGAWDFSQLTHKGAAMSGNSDGAAPAGTGPLRIWIGTK